MAVTLKDIPFLAGASRKALKDAEAEVEYFCVPGGWTLFEAGEPADAMYFVLSGSLGAFRPFDADADGEPDLIGHIRAGEPVGEMALIMGETHSANVFALRDTELVRLNRLAFNRLVRAHPSLMQSLARMMLFRSRQRAAARAKSEPRVFALIATSPSVDIETRAKTLQKQVWALGKRCVLVGSESISQDVDFFEDLERRFDVILLHARMGDTGWYKQCLRQADRFWLLARRDARPSMPMPLTADDNNAARRFRLVDVVLLDEGGANRSNPSDWITAVQPQRLLWWRNTNDVMRLARHLAGRSVGLVLSGGGAKAYAHIGVVRALREAGYPIDVVGGTSMGAVVAACVAMGWDDDEIDRRIRKGFVQSNPLGDFNLPVVAMTRGRRVDKRLEEHFGGAVIEDLKRPFFAVSTNLSTGKAHIYRSGKLTDALRPSLSLPGILPPVVVGDDIFVDGAVVNNLPVNVMRRFHRGQTIAVDVAEEAMLNPEDFRDPPGFTKWVARHGLRSAPPIASLLLRSATLHVNPSQGRELADIAITPELNDVELRDWKAYDEAVKAGYYAAVAAMQSGAFDVLAKMPGAVEVVPTGRS